MLEPLTAFSNATRPDGALSIDVIVKPLRYLLVPPTVRLSCPSSTLTVPVALATPCLTDMLPIDFPSAL